MKLCSFFVFASSIFTLLLLRFTDDDVSFFVPAPSGDCVTPSDPDELVCYNFCEWHGLEECFCSGIYIRGIKERGEREREREREGGGEMKEVLGEGGAE